MARLIAARVTATDFEIEPLLRQLRPDLVGTLLEDGSRRWRRSRCRRGIRRPRAGSFAWSPSPSRPGASAGKDAGPILVRREPGRFTIERLELAGRLGAATGTGRLDDSGAIEATLRGQVPLALLSALRPEIREASGRLDLDLRIGGTTAKPILLGRARSAAGCWPSATARW